MSLNVIKNNKLFLLDTAEHMYIMTELPGSLKIIDISQPFVQQMVIPGTLGELKKPRHCTFKH